MASLQKVKVGRQSYYRIVESRRVNGKPRPVPILHLGTADQLLQRLLAHREPQLTVRSYQHGDVAALKAMADRLGLVALMDRHLPLSRRPLSIGTTLLLAAIFVAATVRKAPADLGGDRRGGAGVQSPVDRPETSGLMSKRG